MSASSTNSALYFPLLVSSVGDRYTSVPGYCPGARGNLSPSPPVVLGVWLEHATSMQTLQQMMMQRRRMDISPAPLDIAASAGRLVAVPRWLPCFLCGAGD